MKFEELQSEILNWAYDKSLINPKNAPKQFMKFIEESGELARAILKDDVDEEIDAFGDVLVTIIILAEQRHVNLIHCLHVAYNVIKNRKGKTVNGTFIKE
jgi:NTP pyrophosphatase (non-canonical NTP hydrolase)